MALAEICLAKAIILYGNEEYRSCIHRETAVAGR